MMVGRKGRGLAGPRKSILPPPLLTGIQVTDLYSNCLKMSAENKINQKNTWGLDLIDYIDDIVEEENTDFARASCTIDASIKIYSTRVDAVHLDTYKVLGGLSRTNVENDEEEGKENQAGRGGDQESDDDEDEDEYRPGARRKKKGDKKKGRAGGSERKSATLEKNIKALNTDTLDLAFDIDPLFQKTSAEFDEGGAKGLLLNNLGIDTLGRLVFGSQDFAAGDSLDLPPEAMPFQIDFDECRKVYGNADPAALQLFPEFVAFAAQAWARPAPGIEFTSSSSDASAQEDASATAAAQKRADFFSAMAATAGGEDFAWDDDDFDDGAPSDDSDDDDNDGASLGMSSFSSASTQADTLAAVFGPGRAESSAASALDAVLMATRDRSGASEYGFYKPSKMKGWAGPAQWKYSAAHRATSKAASGAPKKKKAKFFLDLSPPLSIDFAALSKTSKKATKLKASTRAKVSPDAFLLPKDIHYDIAELTTFGLRPRFSLAAPAQTRASGGPKPSSVSWAVGSDNDDDDDNGDYWGRNAFDDDHDEAGSSAPFGFGAVGAAEGSTMAGDIQLLEAPRKIQKVDLQVSKVAKKVDMKALKKGVWASLTEDEPRAALASNKASAPVMEEEKRVKFSEICADLPEVLPRRIMTDASVQFAFVCLLHLCNEKGLVLEGQEDMLDFSVHQDPVVASRVLEAQAGGHARDRDLE